MAADTIKNICYTSNPGPHYGGCSVPTNTGGFIRLAGSIGARIGNTAGAFLSQSLIESSIRHPGGISSVFLLLGGRMILVNKYGRRAVNEKRDYADRTMAHFHWDPVRAEWTNMLTFMIFDQRIATLWRGVPPIRVPERPSPYVIVGKNLVVLERLLVERLEALQQYTGKAYPGPQLRY